MTMGERLHNLRKYKKLSLKELAEKTGISRSNLNRYERDMSRPTAEYIKGLCAYYQVSADYILFGKETEELKKEGWEEGDPELAEMVRRLIEMMKSQKPYMRSWVIMQFARAFQEERLS